MLEEKINRIKSLNNSETEIFLVLFRGGEFYVSELHKEFNREVPSIRSNLTKIYTKLDVPKSIKDKEKRGYVVSEYSEAYMYLFNREEWERQRPESERKIFIVPPDPTLIDTSKEELKETDKELATYKNRVINLRGRRDELESTVSTLEDEIKELKKRPGVNLLIIFGFISGSILTLIVLILINSFFPVFR